MSINLFKVYMSPSVGEEVTKTLYSGMVTQGPKAEEYEKNLRTWFGLDQLLAVNSGTSALELAVELSGVNAGDTVISTPMTCSATNTAILSRQANIVWADIDPNTGNITKDTVEEAMIQAMGFNLKAVMMVHWGGLPCNIYAINKLAHAHGLKTIEDAAHAIGAVYDGKKIGNLSDFTCFSTQAIKHLTTVDGGILGCKDPEDHRVAKLLRWFGLDREGPRKDFRCELDLVRAGRKAHMNDVNATIGIENLKALDHILYAHRSNAMFYSTALADVPGIKLLREPPGAWSSSWLYTFRVENPAKRQDLMDFLAARGIQTSQVHAPNHHHTFTRNFGPKDLPGVELFSKTQLNIPVGWWVTVEDREFIAASIKEFAELEL